MLNCRGFVSVDLHALFLIQHSLFPIHYSIFLTHNFTPFFEIPINKKNQPRIKHKPPKGVMAPTQL